LRTFFRTSRKAAATPAFVIRLAATLFLSIAFGSQIVAAKPKYAGIVIDAKTGKVLYAKNADARRYPASLTKMMTLYLVFEDLKRGKINLNSRVVMSRFAASQPPSKLGIKAGRSFTVRQGIFSLVTKSANDVATALGEKLAGSEKAFAKRMTRKARQLGMRRTVFKNANGLPNRNQVTTARDMAKLGLALKEHFPREFRYFKTRSFAYGRKRYRNNNRLLGKVKGVDGIKTGYTRASGFNLVSSVNVGKRRIVAVVLGGKSGRSRNAQMSKLIGRYLPRATRGRARILIARAQPPGRNSSKSKTVRNQTTKPVIKQAPTIIAAATLPKKRPVIGNRNSNHNRVQVAYEASTTSAYAVGTDDIRQKLLKLAASSIPLPSPSPVSIGLVKNAAKVEPQRIAMIKAPKGWQIQIGATADRQLAKKLLAKARSRAGKTLASKPNYLEPVTKGNTTLIRARFAGFSSKNSARKACKYLVKRKFACLAINN